MAYATSADVSVRWARTPSDEEAALIEVRLNDLERTIRRRIPTLDDQVVSGAIDVEDLIQVESEAVLRLVRNPDGYLSESDGNYTYMLRSDLSSGKLEVLPEEWLMLGVTSTRMAVLAPSYGLSAE